jgi:hypothetical protein
LVNTVSLAAGDKLSFKSVPTGTPTSPGQIRFAWIFSGAANVSTILGSTRGTTMSNTATEYHGIQENAAGNATRSNKDQVIPTGGTIRDLYVETDGAPGATKSYDFTFILNGVDQTLTCQISGTNTECNDTTHTVTVVAGDLVSMKSVPTNTPTAKIARWGFKWAPTTDGESLILGSSGSAMNTAGSVRYLPVSGTSQTWGATEANMTNLFPAVVLKKFFVNLVTAPGGAASYTFKTRKNTADGSLSVVISGANTTGSDTTNSDTLVATDKVAISSLSASVPASSVPRWGIVQFIDPSPAPTATPTPTNTATPTNTPTPTATSAGPCGRYVCTKVTNLNNSGAGSLRACVEGTGPRLCVFETSGKIALTTALKTYQ